MSKNRLKFRVYDIRRKVYFNDPVPPLNSDGTLAFQSSHPDFQKYYITEFCTGLKDKNGNLIYEGDIVYDSVYENNFVVSWDNDRTGYILSANNTNHIDYLSKILIERHNLKIIGNIHEQAEQKDK